MGGRRKGFGVVASGFVGQVGGLVERGWRYLEVGIGTALARPGCRVGFGGTG